jgi:hypothetical protein
VSALIARKGYEMANNANNTIDQPGYRDVERERELARAREAEDARLARDGRPTERIVERPVERPMERPMERPVERRAEPVNTVAPDYVGPALRTPDLVAVSDRVRWGPIWAGVLTTFTIFLVLEFLGIGLGLISLVNGNQGTTSGISTLIAGLIAFFIGGWVAEASSVARGGRAGLLNGFMVWALVTSLILAFSVFGLGSLFGALGAVVGTHSVSVGGTVSNSQVGNVSRVAGWSAFIWLVVSAILAMIGGLLGSIGRAFGWQRR